MLDEVTRRPLFGSVDQLLDGATDREPFLHSDSKSGSAFERVRIGGRPHVVKYVHIDHDWTMRLCGDVGCKPLQVWAQGLMDLVPERIEHGMVGVAGGLGRNGWGAALLMRDLSGSLEPEGDAPISLEHHLGYLDTMAALAARTWGWPDDPTLVPLANRYLWFGDANLVVQAERGWPDPVPRIAAQGWERFFERVPATLGALVRRLRADPTPLVVALARTPWCFLHGDWKLGNLGTAADGRTVLIDWTYPGIGPIGHDLGWYLALNAARLPHTKEEAIAALRTALERHGVQTEPWWDAQVELSLLGTVVEFGWEKALGGDDELGWWCDRALSAARRL